MHSIYASSSICVLEGPRTIRYVGVEVTFITLIDRNRSFRVQSPQLGSHVRSSSTAHISEGMVSDFADFERALDASY